MDVGYDVKHTTLRHIRLVTQVNVMRQANKKASKANQAAQVKSLANQIAQLKAQADAWGGTARPSRVSKQNKRGRQRVRNTGRADGGQGLAQVGAAVVVRQPMVGLADLQCHKCSWVAGKVYVGNGTLGAANGVYFRTAATNPAGNAGYTVTPMVPVAPGDQYLGASYMQVLQQLYRRKRFRSIKVWFRPIQSSTANNLTLTVAPMRGPPGFNEEIVGSMSTVAANSQDGVMSLTGTKTVDGFIPTVIDLTPYIAGGSGAKQNEFANSATSAGGTWLNNTTSQGLGSCPCCFYVAGTSSLAALEGTNTHTVTIEAEIDWLDFVGGMPVPSGDDGARETREEKRKRLMAELSELVRNDNNVKRDASREPSPARLP